MANTSGRENSQRVRLFSAWIGPLCLLAGLFTPRIPAVERTARQTRPAARYAIGPLGPPLVPGPTWFEHLVINDQGQIAGNLRDERPRLHACLFKDGKLLRLPQLGHT